MRDENEYLMNQKKNAKDLERSEYLKAHGTTPQAIGDGYSRQLAAMQEQDR